MYITFGQDHAHAIGGKTYDKDCVAVIECEGFVDGREKAFDAFGDKFSFSYMDDQFDMGSLDKYYHRGLIELD